GSDGLLVDADAIAIARQLQALRRDRAPLAAIRAHLATRAPRSSADMAADYRRLLPVAEARGIARPPAVAEASPAATAEGALQRRILEAELGIARLLDTQAAQEKELARRADWGFALNRRIGELDREVARLQELCSVIDGLRADNAGLLRDRAILQARSDELERVHRSRSWRLMGPARRLARAVRALRTRAGFHLRRAGNMLKRLRLSLSTRGVAGTLRHLRQRRRGDATGPLALRPVVAPVSRQPPASLPTSDTPAVSIIIPIHGKLPYTCACLAALV